MGTTLLAPLLEADSARIQTPLRSNRSVDGSIYGVSEHVACQLTVQSRGPSGSRRSNWTTVGTIFCANVQDITFEKEVTQWFRDLQGSSKSVDETLV